ncbi:MAG: DUF1015 domain-containing protein [Chloroflexota bacterium]
MTEIRPFRALRYDPSRVTPDDVIAPPYDVVGADAVAALHARSPYNAAHLENPAGSGDSRFAGAKRTLDGWLKDKALVRDAAPALYVYEQRAKIEGKWVSRRCVFARTRLHRPEEGIVRPHEATLSGPREERLRLIRATRTNISPIFATFLDPTHAAGDLIAKVAGTEPDFEAHDRLGDRHRLWVVTNKQQVGTLVDVLGATNITIADGHHRTHTALDYRDECAAKAGKKWTGNEPENFALMGLIPEDDPGLVILPIHRLVKDEVIPERFLERLSALYRVETLSTDGGADAVEAAWERVQANGYGPTAFAILGVDGPHSIHLATARAQEAIDAAMPQELSTASKRLDARILTETVLTPIFGIDRAALAAGRVEFTESVEEAREAVESGACRLAFLINATRVDQVTAVADAAEVMPQKSTFFYPKLATGLVFNSLDD